LDAVISANLTFLHHDEVLDSTEYPSVQHVPVTSRKDYLPYVGVKPRRCGARRLVG